MNDEEAPPRISFVPLALLGVLFVVIVLVGAALLVDQFGPSAEVDDRLDMLAGVIERSRPASASAVETFRNDECDSGVNEVGTTFRGKGTIDRSRYLEVLPRLGWKISPSEEGPGADPSEVLATRRLAWGTAYFLVTSGLGRNEIDVSAGYSCLPSD